MNITEQESAGTTFYQIGYKHGEIRLTEAKRIIGFKSWLCTIGIV